MTTSFALLGLLHQGPSYGYDLKRAYDTLFGAQKPLAFGQVYATLARLVRDKRISMESTEQADGPERKRYELTAHGRDELTKWLQSAEPAHPGAQVTLFVKVVTAILLDAAPDKYLDIQRREHLSHMRELTKIRRAGDLAQSLQADYALFHIEADLRWIDVTSSRLEALAQEIKHAK